MEISKNPGGVWWIYEKLFSGIIEPGLFPYKFPLQISHVDTFLDTIYSSKPLFD